MRHVKLQELISISLENGKLGYIPSVSLVPDDFCRSMPCYHEGCYAVALYKARKNVRKAWQKNTDLCRKDRTTFFAAIDRFLRLAMPPFFRWHVGGEIPDENYLCGIVQTAASHPDCRFLVYTKRYDLLHGLNPVPKNLAILMSIWKGLEYPSNLKFRKAFTGVEAQKRAFPCPGYCGDCRACWISKKDIVFDFK